MFNISLIKIVQKNCTACNFSSTVFRDDERSVQVEIEVVFVLVCDITLRFDIIIYSNYFHIMKDTNYVWISLVNLQ